MFFLPFFIIVNYRRKCPILKSFFLYAYEALIYLYNPISELGVYFPIDISRSSTWKIYERDMNIWVVSKAFSYYKSTTNIYIMQLTFVIIFDLRFFLYFHLNFIKFLTISGITGGVPKMSAGIQTKKKAKIPGNFAQKL